MAELPKGWTSDGLEACIVCNYSTAARDRQGRALHPGCAGLRPAPEKAPIDPDAEADIAEIVNSIRRD